MKKLLLLFSLSLALSLSSKGQTSVYHPFPDSDAVWNQIYYNDNDTFPCSFKDEFSYIMSGDTIINSLVYHKIYRPFVHRAGVKCNIYESLGYMGALRQNISAKNFFFVQKGHSNEGLLYDFSLTVGDTLHIESSILCPHTKIDAVIHLVDSILVGSTYRRELWAYMESNITSMIEGIGSYKGLLEVGCYGLNGERWWLTCFSQNGIRIYPDTGTCNAFLAVENISAKNISITLSPNPFHTTATLKINSELRMQNAELRIYDVMGRLWFRASPLSFGEGPGVRP